MCPTHRVVISITEMTLSGIYRRVHRDAKILKQRPDDRNQPGARAGCVRVDTGLETEGLY